MTLQEIMPTLKDAKNVRELMTDEVETAYRTEADPKRRMFIYADLRDIAKSGKFTKEFDAVFDAFKKEVEETERAAATPEEKEDSLSFLLKNGMSSEQIRKHQSDGIPLDELAAASKRVLQDGGTLAEEEGLKEDGRSKSKPFLTEDTLCGYLESRGMEVRLNVITHDIEISGVPDVYNPETVRNDLPVILHDALKQKYRCDRQTVADLLSLIAGRNRYNPVLEMIDGGEWDKRDYLDELVKILGIRKEDVLSQTLLYKWLAQCYQMLKNDIKRAYGADGMLVLQGAQGIGKTSFVRSIGIRPDFVKLGQYLDPRDKDTYRRCTSAWIVELGEIETTLKSDVERLKAFITAELDEYRLPYGRVDQKIARRSSLIGTCNSERFLIDPTGSRRFWTIPIENIDLNRLMSFDALQLWRQIKVICADHPNDFRLTKEERQALEARNCYHEKPLKAQEEIEDILADAEQDPNGFEWRYVTVSEFKEEYSSLHRYSVNQIGTALNKLGIKTERPRADGKQEKRRKLPCHKWGCTLSPVNTQKHEADPLPRLLD